MDQPRCIYCLKPSGTTKGIPHVFPEAIFQNGPTLPLGSVCDTCNQYIGSNLEEILIRHPFFAVPLQLAGLPGKKGKPRNKIGIYEREVVPGTTITFPIEPPKFEYNEFGIRTALINISPNFDPKFNMDCFRRALYHIAFNLSVLNRGLQSAFEPRFNAVRKYVREPKKNEKWPFIMVTKQLSKIPLCIGAQSLDLEGADIVRLQIFHMDFYLDLLNSGCLLTMKTENENSNVNVALIGPDWKPTPLKKGEPGVYFRASIT